jgi:hypothetical protein
MGRQIVYCEGCGNSLREDDFDRGKARLIDNRPFCTKCRPYEDHNEPPKRASSGKVPAQPPPRKSATERVPIVSPPPRRPPAANKQSNPLPIIAGVGGVVFLILMFAVTQSSSHPPPPPEKPSTPLIIDIPKPKPAVDPTPTPPPPPPVRDPQPPPPPPRRDPPANPSKPSDPLHVPTAAEKFEAFLGQIRQMIQEDERKERSTEILNMFTAAAKIAGPRATEVEKLKNEYVATLDEPTRRAAMWSEWKITSSQEAGFTGLLASHGDRASVYMTHPLDRKTPATLEREVDIPSGKKTTLSFWVAPHQQGDFELRVYVDNKEVLKEVIGPPGSGWRQKKIDLSLNAGKRITLRLEDFPNDRAWEHAYWSDLTIASE